MTTIGSDSGCLEREKLWQEYNRKVDNLELVMGALKTALGFGVFSVRVACAHEAKGLCAHARAAWEAHVTEHRCDRQARSQAA